MGKVIMKKIMEEESSKKLSFKRVESTIEIKIQKKGKVGMIKKIERRESSMKLSFRVYEKGRNKVEMK